MKKIVLILLIIVVVMAIVGIIIILNKDNKSIYPNLPEEPIAFSTTEFIDTADDDAGYLVIEYNGRRYMPYGTIKRSVKESDIDRCIGYIVHDEKFTSMIDVNNTDTRIYLLAEDNDNNFLMEYYIGTHLMNQPIFWRAVDTKGKEIFIPNCIDSLEYNYWK